MKTLGRGPEIKAASPFLQLHRTVRQLSHIASALFLSEFGPSRRVRAKVLGEIVLSGPPAPAGADALRLAPGQPPQSEAHSA